MSDNKDNKKKGFFSNLFSGFRSSKQSKSEESSSKNLKDSSSDNLNDIPSKTALNKMKKADLVSVAKKHGLELDISLTKVKLLEEWEIHFDKSSAPSAVDDAATSMAESASEAAEEAPVEEEASSKEEVKISLDEKSPAQIINSFESKQMKSDIPEFRPGDTVVVSVRVKEGDRTRLQAFEGVVMGVKKAGLNSSFIVRKISSGIGVERTFQTHSPMIDSIKVKRKGDVRQAKLFYLRDRSGKSARIKERLE